MSAERTKIIITDSKNVYINVKVMHATKFILTFNEYDFNIIKEHLLINVITLTLFQDNKIEFMYDNDYTRTYAILIKRIKHIFDNLNDYIGKTNDSEHTSISDDNATTRDYGSNRTGTNNEYKEEE